MNKLKLFPLLFFIILLNGCSSFGWLKFWDSEDEQEGPAELFSIEQSLKISTDWSESFGNENNFGRLIPSVYEGKVYFISSEGFLACLDADSGKIEWSKRTNLLGFKCIICLHNSEPILPPAPVIKIFFS